MSFVERVGCGVVDVIDCEVGVKGWEGFFIENVLDKFFVSDGFYFVFLYIYFGVFLVVVLEGY